MIFDTVGTETLRKTLFWKLKSLSIRDLRAGGGRGRKSLRLNDLKHDSLAGCVPKMPRRAERKLDGAGTQDSLYFCD